MKRQVETIDLTPTWEDILPTLLMIWRDSSPHGQKQAMDELTRMAKLADAYVEHQKAGKTA